MSDFRRIETPTRRGLSWRAVALLVLLAFAVGLALAAFAVQRFHLFAPQVPVASSSAAKPTTVVVARPMSVDPVTLATREAVLAGQLAALEARVGTVFADAQAAGTQAGRAESLLVAFAARRAIDRGLNLGYLEGQLRLRFGVRQPQAVAYVVQQARSPLTLGDLREGLAAIGPDLASGASLGWTEGVRRELGNLVVLRRGGTPSTLPEDRLARARRLLEGGQVEAARAEVARLPGAAQATNWTEAARRYVTTRHALDVLESAALRSAPTVQSITGPVATPVLESARSAPSRPVAP